MTMRSPRHGGLYYPQDGPTLQDQIRAREGETAARPTALLLPHAAWSHILPLLHQTLAQARSLSPALIVLLAPHHGKRKNSALMISAANGLSLPHQEVPFARDAATALATRFSLQVDEEAFDDESSWELLVPLLSSYYPGVPILPILTGELSGSHRNNLTSLLKEIKKADPSTLFVVTANANSPLASPSAEDGSAESGDRELGIDPATGQPVQLKIGRFGPYVEITPPDGEKPKRSSLPKGWSPASLDLDRALRLLALPREVGVHPEDGKMITAGLGRYGPFVLHAGTYANVSDIDEVFEVGLNRAVALLAEKRAGRPGRGTAAAPLKDLGAHPETGEPIHVMAGRFGPYVKSGKINATLPKGAAPEDLTLEDALPLLAAKAGAAPKKKAPAAKKAASPKKAAAPKKESAKKPAAKKAPATKAKVEE